MGCDMFLGGGRTLVIKIIYCNKNWQVIFLARRGAQKCVGLRYEGLENSDETSEAGGKMLSLLFSGPGFCAICHPQPRSNCSDINTILHLFLFSPFKKGVGEDGGSPGSIEAFYATASRICLFQNQKSS